MAKASAGKKKQTAGPEHADTRASATVIAGIDRQIAALIQQRAEMVKAAASPTAASACAAGFDELALAKIWKKQAALCRKRPAGRVSRTYERLPGLGAAAADRLPGTAL